MPLAAMSYPSSLIFPPNSLNRAASWRIFLTQLGTERRRKREAARPSLRPIDTKELKPNETTEDVQA
jgi:hypothetical protein